MPTALIRDVPDAFVACLTSGERPQIDVPEARRQHTAYREALAAGGYTLEILTADEAHPDCPFVEDTALVVGGTALVTRPRAPERRGETGPVADRLAGLGLDVERMEAPATLDGGDVLAVGRTLFAGRSRRTNEDGIAALERWARRLGLVVVLVPVRHGLHLKSGINDLGQDGVVMVPGSFDRAVLPGCRVIETAPLEEGAANMIGLPDGAVLAPAGHPRTAARLADAGYEVRTVPVGQFAAADGGLTCLSIRW